MTKLKKKIKKKFKKKLKNLKKSVDTFLDKVYIHYHRRTTQVRHNKASGMSNSFLTKQGRKEKKHRTSKVLLNR